MPESVSEAPLIFYDDRRQPVAELRIVAEKVDTLQKLTREESAISGEEPIQLLENSTYEFVFSSRECELSESPVISRSKIVARSFVSGRIVPQSYTGLLPFTVFEKGDSKKIVAEAAVEVRSRKLDYREDYRFMLDDIASRCNDLLMNIRSPSMARLATDPVRDQESISQRFAFIGSILKSKEFRDSINRILKMPHRKYVEESDERAIERGVKIGSRTLREIASRVNRRKLPTTHPLYGRMVSKGIAEPSVPTKLSITRNIETTDAPENRFVKHTLNTYGGFLNIILNKLSTQKPSSANTRLINEISQLSGELNSILSHDFFKDISHFKGLSLSSPVLQKKAGYRELLQTWLKFNLAANLSWSGGGAVFGAGKKDMDILYEYWLFFQLHKIVGDIFNLPQADIKELIENQSDGFGLKLKSGEVLSFKGHAVANKKRIDVVFSYNRTFGGSSERAKEGSWSLQMRPDFTLSIYPSEFTIEEAEARELAAHIHFDAKYRMDKLEEIFVDDSPNSDEEIIPKQVGKATKPDLLKMHSYKDAIKRTVGSYVLYPGSEDKILREYEDILPSLGAFAVRPDNKDSTAPAKNVSDFIKAVVEHVGKEATDRERTNSI